LRERYNDRAKKTSRVSKAKEHLNEQYQVLLLLQAAVNFRVHNCVVIICKTLFRA
jgi:hypothetical protein